MKRSKHWKTMVNILDGMFPKGDSACRGEAMVFLSFIEMMLQGRKFDSDGQPIMDEKK